MGSIFLDRATMTVPGGDTQSFGVHIAGDTVWAAYTTEFIAMSPDFGTTWQRFRPDSSNNPQPNPFLGDPGRLNRYYHLNYRAFDVTLAGATIWASTNSGVNRSTDGGRTWTNYDAVGNGISGDFVPSVAINGANGSVWIAAQSAGIDEQSLKDNLQEIFPDGVLSKLDWDLDRDNKVDGPR